MKALLTLYCLTLLASFSPAADGPVRVLYFDPNALEQTKAGPLHLAMEAMGRDAIWFDYVTDEADLTPGFLARYDVVCERIQGMAAVKHTGALPVTEDIEPDALRKSIVARLRPERVKSWEAFLAGCEPEKREANPNVANYEKRPRPITFQQPLSVAGSMQRTQVPADLKLELFASEPDIAKPIAMAWDERGRCWIAETRDYPHGVTPSGEGHDSIKICEDTDGDGRADKFTVFADRLNLPTSLVFVRGGVIVTQPPRLIFLKDADGDDKADVREVLMDAWGVQDTHAQASNLHYGLDNWIYGCVGYSGFKGAVGGREVAFTMGTYRFRPDGSAIEFLHQFTNNAWAQSANAAGDQFGGTANGAPIFYGGIPASAFPAGVRPFSAKKINVVEKCHAITPHYRQVDVFGGYTAAAGSAFIESPALPRRFQGKAMVCEPTMKVLALMDVQPEGAGYVAKDFMNLVASTDEWMSPVFAEVGPDGAVWFADWQNFIIQHNPTPSVERAGYKAETGPGGAHLNALRDHSRGRIYRVVARESQALAGKELKTLKGMPDEVKLAALGNPNPFWRLTAQRLLVEESTRQTEALRRLVAASDGGIAALHALWTLHGLGQLDEATLKGALLARDARLRRNAIRALGDDAKSAALFFGSGVVSDPDPHTRLAALVKLAAFPTTPEIKTLAARLATDARVKGDEWLDEAVRLVAKKHGAEVWKEGPNLLPNPGFELLGENGLPQGWTRRDYGSRPGNPGAEWKVIQGPDHAHGGGGFVRCITRDDGDTSLFADVVVKPNTMYRLSAWVRSHALRGKVSLNDHLGRAETEKLTARESGWVQVETIFNSRDRTKASINLLHVARGDGFFDDVKLCELLPAGEAAQTLVGDAKRGEEIFWKHPVAACMNCHALHGKGSTVGPALDGIASRKDAAYINQSLLEPNAVLAEGYVATPISPMPPMNLILKPQELEDIKAFLMSLTEAKKREAQN